MSRSARPSPAKLAYSRPTVTVYGGLTKLTATGTITTGENAGSMVANMA